MKTLLINLIKLFNKVMRRLCYVSHSLQFRLEWLGSTSPEWFDHFLDQYYGWPHRLQPYWLERGIFNLLAIKQDSKVLELCCGDGFNTRFFYSHRCQQITALDFDPTAIAHALKNNQMENIRYIKGDIRTDLPKGRFNNIIWDAAIEHFTEKEIDQIVGNIKERLENGGILSGYTLVERHDGQKHLHQHEYEFKSKEDLLRFFTPWFKNVRVWETIYPERHNLYFFASDSEIPFDPDWKNQVAVLKTSSITRS